MAVSLIVVLVLAAVEISSSRVSAVFEGFLAVGRGFVMVKKFSLVQTEEISNYFDFSMVFSARSA